MDKKLGKILAKRGDDVASQCAFVLSVDDALDVYVAPSALDCATWCTAISNTTDAARHEPLQQVGPLLLFFFFRARSAM